MGMWNERNATVAAEAVELREEILRRMAAARGGASARKRSPGGEARRRTVPRGGARSEDEEVCVTGGLSFLGSATAGRLPDRGSAVRLVVASREESEKVAEMGAGAAVRPVVAEAMDAEGLRRAFDGCAAVFHASAAVDPSGLSGYSKQMADVEVRAAERVMEGCVRAESVKKCIFTSSLSACVWRTGGRRPPAAIDESCWSDEDLCREKKLWFALGKTMAEKAAWRIAQRRRGLKLVTVCPALLTGAGFVPHNSTASIASLKGARELFAEGLLAKADVESVADAQVQIYESMTGSSTAGGRYICFDHLIRIPEEVDELEQLLGIARRTSTETSITTTTTTTQHHRPEPAISKQKLSRLLMAANSLRRCTYDVYYPHLA